MDDRAFAPDSLLVHASFIRRIARALVRDEHAAEDVVQETWAAALASPPRRGGPLGPWLTAAARNFARQLWRRDQRRSERERAAARDEALPSAASLAEREESLRSVVEAVLALSEPYRSTVIQRFYEDLPPRTIAARGGLPVATVHTRLRRALVQLRETLGAQGKERRDWRCALLVYAGGESAPVASTSVTTTLLLWPTLLLMKTKTFLAAALLLGLAFALYVIVEGRGEKTPGDASQPRGPAVASESTTAPHPESAPDSGAADPVRRAAPSYPQPRTELAAAAGPDSPPDWFDAVIRVVDVRDQPVPEARVELWEMRDTLPIRESARRDLSSAGTRANRKEPLLRATTDAAGRCTLRVEREPLIAHAEHKDLGASNDDRLSRQRVVRGQELTLTLQPVVQVSVLVLRADGVPAAGAMVEVVRVRDHGSRFNPPPAATDPEGRCRFLLNAGYSFFLRARDRGEQTFGASVATTKGSNPVEVVLRFPGALSLAGTLRAADGTPAAGRIALWEQRTEAQRKEDPSGGFRATREIDAPGEFRIDVPYEGRFDLIGSATGHANSAIVTLEVSQAEPHPRGDVRLTRPASLAGVVVRANGTPVAGAHLSLTVGGEATGGSGLGSEIGPPDVFGRDVRTTRSGADGVFRIERLHPRANYTLVCTPDARRSAVRSMRNDVVAGAGLRLVITDEQLATGRIVGTVVAESTGKPISRFQQWTFEYGDGKGGVFVNKLDAQDQHGAFRSEELGFGQTFAIAIACEDYAPALVGPVTISQKEHRFEVRLPEFGKVSVRVLEADGSPAADAGLGLRALGRAPLGTGWAAERSDAAGTYVWEKVPPGEYMVIASRDPRQLERFLSGKVAPGGHAVIASGEPGQREQRACAVQPGQKTEVEIRLPR